ncbi:2-dehydropantoate 2-reductase N-terminal domain-containing protein [Kitasatospora sp. MAP5-34]|uniref:ketopantoate reductase family protein n=1 Tax=Kitasatospora sp. MAP5-34 TaxID=3035102 RepID=UPI00247356BC|nr:2-dehydropantoate 2-reductase N-terminal domain-containing protein [Kitasatospora sp. MAP5-34]MDH6575827.1 2-dehydropantoate 2-reductase [Kitasatospora sp. MAP5-34]
MRYIIIGAGAVGGSIGGRLFESGHEVVLVARGAHLAALRSDGLRLSTPDGTRTLPIPAVDGPQALELRTDDVLILAVKTQHAEALLTEWAARPVGTGAGGTGAGGAGAGGADDGGVSLGTAGELLPMVCAQNGVESERLALRRFRRVYGMCVWLPSSNPEPGRVSAHGAPLTGFLHVGRYPDGVDGTVRQISADLEKSKFLAPVRPDVMAWKYGKLLGNVANALEAVGGPVEGEPRMALYHRVTAEYVAVLAAAGIAYPGVEEQHAVRGDLITVQPLEGEERAGGSSWQSLSRGTGTIEADYLNGEAVLLGRLHGVPTPLNEALQRLANEFARTGRAAGSLSDAELDTLLAL